MATGGGDGRTPAAVTRHGAHAGVEAVGGLAGSGAAVLSATVGKGAGR